MGATPLERIAISLPQNKETRPILAGQADHHLMTRALYTFSLLAATA